MRSISEIEKSILSLDERIKSLDKTLDNLFKGEDYRFKALWRSLPICLIIIGALQVFTYKYNTEQVERFIKDSKDRLEKQENTQSKLIDDQLKLLKEAINNDRDGNITSVEIGYIPRNEVNLRTYPYIDRIFESSGSSYYRLIFKSFVTLRSPAGERGYLSGTAYKWGGAIAEKAMINQFGLVDPNYEHNNYGYIITHNPEILVSEYGSLITYSFQIDRKTCEEIQSIISELSQNSDPGWFELSLIMKKIKHKPEKTRFSLSIGNPATNCGDL